HRDFENGIHTNPAFRIDYGARIFVRAERLTHLPDRMSLLTIGGSRTVLAQDLRDRLVSRGERVVQRGELAAALGDSVHVRSVDDEDLSRFLIVLRILFSLGRGNLSLNIPLPGLARLQAARGK
ncbi:MAG: hypothetical protein O3C17_12535, partial [Planctomycetota bacterium]|nr:hypothetical protein [Planctomycetota bacterium]